MFVGNGDDIANMLMQLPGNCPNCGTRLTFKQAALLAKDSGIKEDAVMCHNCHKAYTVNLSPTGMSFVKEIKTDTVKITENSNKKEENTNFTQFKDTENQGNSQPSAKQTPMNNNSNQNTGNNQQKAEEDSYFSALFYKKDVKTNEMRISKTKTISIIFFIITFIFFLMAVLMDPATYKDPVSLVVGTIFLFVFSLLLTAPVFIVGYLISYVLDREAEKNKQQDSNKTYNQQYQQNVSQQVPNQQYQQNVSQQPSNQQFQQNIIEDKAQETTIQEQDKQIETEKAVEQYFERDNMGTRQDTVEKANAYWLGERFQMEIKPPFTLYKFTSGDDAEKALLELPYIHKAADTGNMICDEVYVFGCYKVSEGNYEAIVCGKDLSYDDFIQAEESFKKHGGTLRNNLEPEKSTKTENKTEDKKESTLKFREKFTKNQFTYECYDAETKEEALDFLKGKPVKERLYYVCVYTPEGDYGRDIDGIYQM